MSYQPCIVIPLYNHGGAVARTVAALAVHGLPIYITDDGSDEATRRALAEVAQSNPCVKPSRLPQNQGKGAAVLEAMRRARRDGCTHALQVDADAQHDAADVPRFIAASRVDPDAVIAGKPIYDASVPKARLYGRYLTHVWVWIETLSFDIADSLCGYRLYPIAPALALADGVRIRTRMDFDTDMIVRLHWRGVPVVNLATRVTYPADGVSHFDVLRDNVRISRTHTRLVCGMLLRLPLLLRRKLSPRGARKQENWSHIAERGTAMGLATLNACYRLLGRRAVKALMFPVIAYFFLTAGRARAASLDYLSRVYARFGPSPALAREPRLRDAFRHFLAFGDCALDKLAAWSGRAAEIPVDFPRRADYARIAASKRGALLIGAHLGNFEMSRALGVTAGHSGINAIVYSEHAKRFASTLMKANPDYGVNLIHVAKLGPDDAIRLQEKIDAGELVFVVGDRTPAAQNGRVSTVDFLGAPADFAQGPLTLAHLLGCPVYLFFCIKEGGRYRIHLELFAERIELERGNRERALAEHIARYAARLEHYCRAAPLQWFNFFDFWKPAAKAVPLMQAGQANAKAAPQTLPDPDHERTQTAHA
jgi:predicted LPLAT superfamily acyltransferase/glycosyltransferase involved in cell wall biosynthesis